MSTPSFCPGCGEPLDQPNRGARRKWCSDRCRKRQYAGRCVDCGAATSGSNGRVGAPQRCHACNTRRAGERQHRRWLPRAQLIVELRARGVLNTQIAEQLGCSRHSVGMTVHRMRKQGQDVTITVYSATAERERRRGGRR